MGRFLLFSGCETLTVSACLATLLVARMVHDGWCHLYKGQRGAVQLVSVQPVGEEELEVLVSVAGASTATVSQRLGAQPEALQEAGVRLLLHPEDCGSLRCVHGQCRHRLVLDPSDPVLLATEGLAFVSPRHSRHTACVCAPGFGGEHPGRSFAARIALL